MRSVSGLERVAATAAAPRLWLGRDFAGTAPAWRATQSAPLQVRRHGLAEHHEARGYATARATPESIPTTAETRDVGATSTLEDRVRRLELALEAQEIKIKEVEVEAKKKGGFAQLITEYGAPFVVWYFLIWSGSLLSIYGLLECGLISWQDTLAPLFQALGLDDYVHRIDSTMGSVVIAIVVNEILEPIRFPVVVLTLKKAMKVFNDLRRKA